MSDLMQIRSLTPDKSCDVRSPTSTQTLIYVILFLFHKISGFCAKHNMKDYINKIVILLIINIF